MERVEGDKIERYWVGLCCLCVQEGICVMGQGRGWLECKRLNKEELRGG